MKGRFKRGDTVKWWDRVWGGFLTGRVQGRVRPGIDSYRIDTVQAAGTALFPEGHTMYPPKVTTIVDDVTRNGMTRLPC